MISIRTGSVWKHYKGGVYVVTGITDPGGDLQKHPIQVVYIGVANGKLWCRPLEDWCNKFTEITGFVLDMKIPEPARKCSACFDTGYIREAFDPSYPRRRCLCNPRP